MRTFTILILAGVFASSAFGFEKQACQIGPDYGTAPPDTCRLSYYYFIPCPVNSWAWALSGFAQGDIIGQFFEVGDVSMYDGIACDPDLAQRLIYFTVVVDASAYEREVPGLCTTEFDVWCCDEYGGPVGPSLWNSGPVELYELGQGTLDFGWTIIEVPDICLTPCWFAHPSRFLITATMTGSDPSSLRWFTDNISTPVELYCSMHDCSCLPALYPRPYNSHYTTIHSGYYGNGGFEYRPPYWFCDGRDTTDGCIQYGSLEFLWRAYFINSGPTLAEPATWGSIKSLYR